MTIPLPQYISRDDLAERLHHEIASLTGTDLRWWTAHQVSPYVARYGQSSHYVVAASGQHILFFADDEDEFGVAKVDVSGQTITDYGLAGDLRDAVGIIQPAAA